MRLAAGVDGLYPSVYVQRDAFRTHGLRLDEFVTGAYIYTVILIFMIMAGRITSSAQIKIMHARKNLLSLSVMEILASLTESYMAGRHERFFMSAYKSS